MRTSIDLRLEYELAVDPRVSTLAEEIVERLREYAATARPAVRTKPTVAVASLGMLRGALPQGESAAQQLAQLDPAH